MRASLLNSSGTVVNVVIHGPDWNVPEGLTIGPDGGEIGHFWNGSEYIVPPGLMPSEHTEETERPGYIADPLHTEALLSLQGQIDELRSQPAAQVVTGDGGNEAFVLLQARLEHETSARLDIEMQLAAVTTALHEFSQKQEGA